MKKCSSSCAVREAEARGLYHGKETLAYQEILFDPHRLKQDLLVDKARELTHQLWKDNIHQIILTRRPLSFTLGTLAGVGLGLLLHAG